MLPPDPGQNMGLNQVHERKEPAAGVVHREYRRYFAQTEGPVPQSRDRQTEVPCCFGEAICRRDPRAVRELFRITTLDCHPYR